MKNRDHKKAPDIVTSSKEYFTEVVTEAFKERKLETKERVKVYIIDLLEFFLHTGNLFQQNHSEGKKGQETLAELYLKAVGSHPSVSIEIFKRLADSSLYISGFFGDSLKRKIVDVDYYVDMGGSAYGHLAHLSSGEVVADVYHEFSIRFLDYVDVLTSIRQKSSFMNQDDLLRLYDRYVLTGSKQAQEQIFGQGFWTPTAYAKKVVRQ